jgi:hypothetical protein
MGAMGSLSLRVRYRPIRIGWCLESQRIDQLETALRFASAFAGGRFNPVVPVDVPELAESLIDRFRVDLLFPITGSESITSFVKAHDYLHWPDFNKVLFHEAWEHVPPRAAFVDVYHAARRLRETRARNRKLFLPVWKDDDPLRLPLLAMAGRYPLPSSIVPDYEQMLDSILGIERSVLQRTDPVPPEIRTRLTPSRLTAVDLDADEWGPDNGIYVGEAENFEDLINFWNLRAAGAGIVFYDPRYAARFKPLLESHQRWLASAPARPWQHDGTISIYRREELREAPAPEELGPVMSHSVGAVSWNGLNIKPALRYWDEQPVLGSVDESERRPTLTFALPQKPVYDHPHLSQQHIAVSIRGSDPWTFMGTSTFFPPYVPELNEYYGRELHFHYARIRSEPRSIWQSISLLTNLSDADVTLRALPAAEIATRLFRRFGIAATGSRPGQITNRLIAQMDGVQGCRVFKIEGVRTLISKHAPDQSFTRSGAVMTIGNADPATNKPRFEPFEDLFIAPRPFRRKLTPHDVLDFLLDRGVFRVGLELTCAHCELPFWVSLDDAATTAQCEYCGKTFGITPQLKDRDWAYRRSGLFGRNDNQQGGIPVAVTLQQLDTALSMSSRMLYTTCLELKPEATTPIEKCETDLVIFANGHSHNSPHQPQLVIGECKAVGGTITHEDAEHLAKVADVLPSRRINVFILFAKMGTFSEQEIEACAIAQHMWHERVIMLGKDELEPYDIDGRYPQGLNLHLHDLEALASNTVRLYPALRCNGFSELRRLDHHRRLQRRAFEFFQERGGEHGRDWEDWFRAENEPGPR